MLGSDGVPCHKQNCGLHSSFHVADSCFVCLATSNQPQMPNGFQKPNKHHFTIHKIVGKSDYTIPISFSSSSGLSVLLRLLPLSFLTTPLLRCPFLSSGFLASSASVCAFSSFLCMLRGDDIVASTYGVVSFVSPDTASCDLTSLAPGDNNPTGLS